jgi:ABC-type Fe3+ transport system substrate-binding protein
LTGKSSIVQEAKKEGGKLTVYGTVEIDEFSGWKRSFEKRYPFIDLEYKREYVYGTPPPLAKKIMDEVKEGKATADAVIVATPLMIQMKGLRLLSRTKVDESAYPKQVRQPQGYWTPLVSIPMIQVYNPELVSERDLPKEALDLTSPKWKDAIVSHDLTLGTLGAYWLASLRPIFGERKWRKLVEGLAENRPRFHRLYDDVVDSVANGETKIGLTVLLHDYVKRKEAKRAVERLKLRDVPVLMSYNAIARTSAGRHPASAELLLDFLTSEEGQRKVGSTYIRIPAKPHVNAPYSLDKLIPGENFTMFPNKDMLPKVQDSIEAFARVFVSEKKENS